MLPVFSSSEQGFLSSLYLAELK